MIIVEAVSQDHDLGRLVDEINAASWDAANDMAEYGVEALREYLGRQDTIFVACHEVTQGQRLLLGIASARVETKPYGRERWLYVDEVDVCADRRRRGAGTAIMRKLLEIAEAARCAEVWLGAEANNQAANALYRALRPDDDRPVVGYTFELREATATPPTSSDC